MKYMLPLKKKKQPQNMVLSAKDILKKIIPDYHFLAFLFDHLYNVWH